MIREREREGLLQSEFKRQVPEFGVHKRRRHMSGNNDDSELVSEVQAMESRAPHLRSVLGSGSGDGVRCGMGSRVWS